MVKIIETLIPANTNARPCLPLLGFIGVTIHETGNRNNGAGAKNHSIYKTVNGGWNAEESYHYVVDDKEAYRLVPEGETTWQSGDGSNGNGNRKTISIEICVNPDSNFETAKDNAAMLTADILKRRGINSANGYVHQHNKWSGKNCPETIRETGQWNVFVDRVQFYLNNGTNQNSELNKEEMNYSMYIFSKNWYLKKYPDVAANKTYKDNPYLHYEKYGKKEGRKPLPPIPKEYNEGSYLELNPDVAAAVKKGTFTSGLHHYSMYGFNENRKVCKNDDTEAIKKRVEDLELKLEEIKKIVD